jgi:hypothetical protein
VIRAQRGEDGERSSPVHQWLFLHSLDSVTTVRRLITLYVDEHNRMLPHSAFRGQTPDEMYVAGVCVLLMRPSRRIRSAIVLKPSTLLRLHRALTKRKYRLLFAPTVRSKPGPKGPGQDVIAAVVDMKWRNPTWSCPRIAQQIALAFGIPLNKDVVRRILAPGTGRPQTRRAVLAHGPRSGEGQSVESRRVLCSTIGNSPPTGFGFDSLRRPRPCTGMPAAFRAIVLPVHGESLISSAF